MALANKKNRHEEECTAVGGRAVCGEATTTTLYNTRHRERKNCDLLVLSTSQKFVRVEDNYYRGNLIIHLEWQVQARVIGSTRQTLCGSASS